MCGLIAATGKIETRYVIALGCLSEKRGSDSAGVAWQVGDKLRVAKVAQNPLVAYPVTLAPAIRHASKYGGPLIGHTRAATTGEVSNKNAHPFLKKESKIAWAHNGIISNYQQFGSYDVDSEALIVGIEKKDFKEFFGPVALVWIENGKLHAFRKGNPLYRGVRRAAVYLASEQNMLAEIGCKRIKELSEGHLYIWEGGKIESSKSIPYNKSYVSRTTYPYTEWAGTEYDNDWRDQWDEKTKTWKNAKGETSSYHGSAYQGCGGGRPRTAGFRFRRELPAKTDEQVIGDAPLVPLIAATGGDITQESGTHTREPEILDSLPIRNGGRLEPDTLAEADAEAGTLADEMAELEKLCTECQANPKAFGRDYCEACNIRYLSNMGLCD